MRHAGAYTGLSITTLRVRELAWYAGQGGRFVRARKSARETTERWENEAGSSPDEQRG